MDLYQSKLLGAERERISKGHRGVWVCWKAKQTWPSFCLCHAHQALWHNRSTQKNQPHNSQSERTITKICTSRTPRFLSTRTVTKGHWRLIIYKYSWSFAYQFVFACIFGSVFCYHCSQSRKKTQQYACRRITKKEEKKERERNPNSNRNKLLYHLFDLPTHKSWPKDISIVHVSLYPILPPFPHLKK